MSIRKGKARPAVNAAGLDLLRAHYGFYHAVSVKNLFQVIHLLKAVFFLYYTISAEKASGCFLQEFLLSIINRRHAVFGERAFKAEVAQIDRARARRTDIVQAAEAHAAITEHLCVVVSEKV